MGILSDWFGSKKPEAPEAEWDSMVEMLHIMVIPSYQTVVERIPMLKGVSVDQYDFFVTNAAVCAALMGIDSRKPEHLEEAERAAAASLTKLWGEDGARAVVDCNDFVNNGLEGVKIDDLGEAMSAVLGMWIVWNLFETKPGDEHMELVSATGRLAFHLSSSYWS